MYGKRQGYYGLGYIFVILIVFILMSGQLVNFIPRAEIGLKGNRVERNGPDRPALHERETRHQSSITEFAGDIESKNLVFMQKGSNSSLTVSLPEDSIVESAEVDVEGRLVGGQGGNAVADYTDTTNNRAWEEPNNNEAPPLTSQPASFKTDPFNVNDYTEVQALDNNFKMTHQAGFNDYPLQLYEFNLSAYYIQKFDLFWSGHYWVWDYDSCDGLNVTIWNVSKNGWEVMGKHYAQGDNDYVNLENTYGSPTHYIHPTTGLLYAAIVGPKSWFNITTRIYTNYICVNMTLDPTPSYPEDPYLDIGGDGDEEWDHQGKYSAKETFAGTDFANELQEHVDSVEPVGGMIDIPFEFGVSRRGGLYISNLTITYITNIEPTNPTSIDSIHFYEDSGWYESGINITDHFQDADDPLQNLTFELHGNTPDIWGAITPDYELNFTSSPDHFGTAYFNVSCRDKGMDGVTSADDRIIYSDDFPVSVFPMDDAPVIRSIDGKAYSDPAAILSAAEDQYLNFTMEAEDIDGDGITYSVNLMDEVLIVSGNNVSFLPVQDHVGWVNFTVTATEMNTSLLADQANVSIRVANTNDPPVIIPMEDMVLDEDTWLNFTIMGADIDLAYDEDEELTYHTNFSDVMKDVSCWELDGETGNFSFLPDNDLVGCYHVNFTVKDHYGKRDWFHANITVNNVNDPPTAKPISPNIVDADATTPEAENLTVNFTTGPGYDPDIIHGDVLAYSWDFNASDGISEDGSGRSVLWTFVGPGNYTVTLTVSDSASPSLENSTSIMVQILAPKVKVGGSDDDDDDDNDDNDDDSDDDDNGGEGGKGEKEKGMGVGSWVIWVIVVLLILFTGIGGFVAGMVIMRKKQRGKADDEKTPASKGDPATPEDGTSPEAPVTTVDLSPLQDGMEIPPEQAPGGESVQTDDPPTAQIEASAPDQQLPAAQAPGAFPLPPTATSPPVETAKAAESPAQAVQTVEQNPVVQPPMCPKCSQPSVYYQEYNCYWCGPCQDYVYPPA